MGISKDEKIVKLRLVFLLFTIVLLIVPSAFAKTKFTFQPNDQTTPKDQDDWVYQRIKLNLDAMNRFAQTGKLKTDAGQLFVPSAIESAQFNSSIPRGIHEISYQYKLTTKTKNSPSLMEHTEQLNGRSLFNPSVWQFYLQHTLPPSVKSTQWTKELSAFPEFIDELAEYNFETIEGYNQEYSKALKEHFTDPRLHIRGAILLGLLEMHSHAGIWDDPKVTLTHMASHLAFADYLTQGE